MNTHHSLLPKEIKMNQEDHWYKTINKWKTRSQHGGQSLNVYFQMVCFLKTNMESSGSGADSVKGGVTLLRLQTQITGYIIKFCSVVQQI
jgi:hypothetical protein